MLENPKDESDKSIGRIEFEAALYRQEHRLFRILSNYWNRNQFSCNDPRLDAVKEALLWRITIALMPTAAITGTGAVAIIGLFIGWQSNILIDNQNKLIENQNYNLKQDAVRIGDWHEEICRMPMATEIKTGFTASLYNLAQNKIILPRLQLQLKFLENYPDCEEFISAV